VQTINEWNNFPRDMVENSLSLEVFKTQLDSELDNI